ncbi:MAG: ABC transporter substrate-binding protein [Candidatus Hodarchaeota archaeon]
MTTPVSQSEIPPRDEIVWTSGYWQLPTTWNPLFWNDSWGSIIMYQPLFEYNYEKGELIGIIGKTIEFSDSLTIEITLRPEAKWSDGTALTAHDVDYTWRWRLQTNMQHISSRISSIEITNNTMLKVHLDSAYPNSRVAWNSLMRQKIVPKHVWEEILNDPNYGNGDIWNVMNFENNWLKEDFPDKWKVASGPYLLYFVDNQLSKEIYKRDDNWWGNDIWGQPEAAYVGHLHYSTNDEMQQAFETDQIDWCGGYFPNIWEIMAKNENITTWTLGEEPYYLSLGGMVELIPNHLRYPFVEPWMRQALAYAMDYDDMSRVATSGYLVRARQGYIDDRSPSQKHVYNATIEGKYHINTNTTKAIEILEANCFNHTDGQWYTNDVPLEYQGIPGAADALIGEPGINVKIGGWKIMTVDGWTDSMIQSTIMATNLTDIGIDTVPDFIEYVTYQSNFQNMNFDLMNLCLGFTPLGDLHTELVKFAGSAGQWTNFSGWYNPEYFDLVNQLEVTPKGSAEEAQICSKIQEILASIMPAIPISPNGFWYTINKKYWVGFPTIADPWIQITGPWSVGFPGAMQMILINLKSTLEPPTTSTTELPTTTTTTTSKESESRSTTSSTSKISSWGSSSVFMAIIASAVLMAKKQRK